MIWVLTYDEVPPSSNTNSGVGGRGSYHGIAKTKLKWQGVFQYMLMAGHVPRPLESVSVKAELQFRDPGRRRDADNYYFAISKPLGDALVKGGWLVDDNPDFYGFERVRISKDKLTHPLPTVKGRLHLTIESPSPRPAGGAGGTESQGAGLGDAGSVPTGGDDDAVATERGRDRS